MEEHKTYWSRQFSRRGVLRAGALGGGALALASACGGSGGESGKASPTGAAQQTPKRGGTLRYRQAGDPPSWSMMQAIGGAATFANHIYSKLIGLKVGADVKPNEYLVEPDLAQAMPEQPDNLTYIFKLRPNVKFQNVAPVNGRALTIDDVKLAVDTYRGEGSPWKADWSYIDTVDAVDAQTLRVRTKEPVAVFLIDSAFHYGHRIFPKELLEGDRMKQLAIGTGPWIRESYDQGNRAVYTRNPDYFRQDQAYLDKLIFVIMPTDASAVAAFQAGDIDVLGSVNCAAADQIARSVPNAQRENLLNRGGAIALDTTKPPFNDVRVRRAMSLAFNRDAESKAIFCGLAEPDQMMFRGSIARALPVDKLGDAAQYFKYDPNRAKQLLAEAGYANGFETVANATPQYGQDYLSTLERAIGDFDKVGVKVKPNVVAYPQFIGEIFRAPYKYEGMMWGTQSFNPDPARILSQFVRSDGFANASKAKDPEIDSLIDKQGKELDVEKRWALLEQLQRVVADRMYWFVRTSGASSEFWQPWLRGYRANLATETNKFNRAWDGRL